MIIPEDFYTILKLLTKRVRLDAALAQLCIEPLTFFNHINNNPEDKKLFETSRQIAAEQMIDSSISGIDECETELDLKKLKMKLDTAKWLAEKLIPETYGSRVDINVNKTIDIVGVLREADKRVFIESHVVDAEYKDILE